MKINTALLLVWTLVLLAVLLVPVPESDVLNPLGLPYFDKWVHLGLFFVSGFVFIYGAGFLPAFRHRLLFGLALGLVLAAGTELGQSLVGRDMSLLDLAADLLGLLSGALFYTLLYSWKRQL